MSLACIRVMFTSGVAVVPGRVLFVLLVPFSVLGSIETLTNIGLPLGLPLASAPMTAREVVVEVETVVTDVVAVIVVFSASGCFSLAPLTVVVVVAVVVVVVVVTAPPEVVMVVEAFPSHRLAGTAHGRSRCS